jgi:hypothetical protein
MARPNARSERRVSAALLAWIFVGLLVLSLAYSERSERAWRDETTYQVHARRIQLGAPLPWIAHTTVDASGAPPPIELLPGGAQFVPGLHVDVPRACLALASALVLAGVLFAASWLFAPELERKNRLPPRAMCAVIAVCGIAIGLVTPTDPLWIGAVLGFVGLPIAVAAACWRHASLTAAFLASAVAALSIVWAQRVSSALSSSAAPDAFDVDHDVLAPLSIFAFYLFIVSALLIVKRLARR